MTRYGIHRGISYKAQTVDGVLVIEGFDGERRVIVARDRREFMRKVDAT
jgi:hypothetical protein